MGRLDELAGGPGLEERISERGVHRKWSGRGYDCGEESSQEHSLVPFLPSVE